MGKQKHIKHVDPIELHKQKERDIKPGDTVVIDRKLYNNLENHRDSDDEVPAHNHGIVKSVIKPRDRDDKGRYLHPAPFTYLLDMQDYVTMTLPNGKEISLFSNSLRKLY